ncbi:MAG: hypothetical protein WKG00_13670 [Polyangiaceae bacterium]
MRRVLTIAAACFLMPASAGAQSGADVALARELFTEGSRLAEAGDWKAARERYARSRAHKRAPLTLYSLGIAQQNTGELVDGTENLRAFLGQPSEPATQPYEALARAAIAEMQLRIGRLRIEVQPVGLSDFQVTLDGKPIPHAALAQDRPADPGEHDVAGEAPGREPVRVRVRVPPGGTERVLVSFGEAPRAVRSSKVVPIALLAGGGALAAAGLVVGLVGVSEASNVAPGDEDAADSARAKALGGDVVVGVGVAAAAVGVVLLLVGSDGAPPARDQAAARASRWAAGPRGIGVRW